MPLDVTVAPFVQELHRKAEEALACPCVADLKAGPCGNSFVQAFTCFLTSTEDQQVRMDTGAR